MALGNKENGFQPVGAEGSCVVRESHCRCKSSYIERAPGE